uniref:Uncharacterized protein n=1 Tax=Siphoviridae sp. ctDmQ3 TaxID=2823570 RepID=A0A8S5L806_9CAUD|nr:MAG TPA: hypothetical protein [Siphoviridae sp. ctDmQ3]
MGRKSHTVISLERVFIIYFEYHTMGRTLMPAYKNDNNDCHLEQVIIFIIN